MVGRAEPDYFPNCCGAAPVSRRSVVVSLIAVPALTLPSVAWAASHSSRDVQDLEAFITKTIGRSPGTRKSLARDTINAINPLKDDNKLLELAALGVLARESSTTEALADDLPRRSKRLIAAVLSDQAELGWSHALAGAWHFEVVRRSRAVSLLLGAGRSEGEKRFIAAKAKSPNDMGIVLLEAITLIYDNAKKYGDRIGALLAEASGKPPKGTGKYERVVAQSAAPLSAIARTKQWAMLEASVRDIY